MSYWSGFHSGCWWSYFEGQITEMDWESFLAFSRRSYTKGRPGDVILTIPYRASAPSPLMRQELAKLIDVTRGGNPITHHAFATDSRLILAINTAINWLSRKPYQERTFGDPAEAIAWLAQCNPAIHPAELAKKILATIPAGSRWRLLAA